MSNGEAEVVNTLGRRDDWAFHPGAVCTATPSPNMTDGVARTSCCSSQVIATTGGTQAVLFAFFNIYFSLLLSLICILLQPAQVQTKSGCCGPKQIVAR